MPDDDVCGHPTKGGDGPPCQNPASEGGTCWIPSHGDDDAENPHGRPKALTDDKKDALINAVGLGLHVKHQAAVAGVHPDTLRRATCCLDTLREPELTTDDPCDFCERYARAHGEGAMNVLAETKPEFRAAAAFGYVKTEKHEHAGEDGGPLSVTLRREVVDDDGD